MRKKTIAVIAGAMALCMAAAGCGAQTGSTEAPAADTAAAAIASTEEAAAEEEHLAWKEEDDAYLTGVTAEDYVELPETYSKLKVVAVKPVDPTDEDVDARIELILYNYATVEEVDRGAKEGDTVSIDYVGKIDGEEFDGGTGSYDLVLGSDSFIEGFEEGLIGVKKGETRDLELTFPENYHPEAGLNGKDVVFTVTVNKVSETVTPKLTDDFVKSLNKTNAFGQAVKDVDDYRDFIRSDLIEEREATYEDTIKSQIIRALLQDSNFKMDPPENMVEKYNYLLTRKFTYEALQSYTDLKTYMTTGNYGATEDNYLDVIRDMAKSYAEKGLICQAVADKEDLNPSEDEVNKSIAEYVEKYTTLESVDELDRLIKEVLREEIMTDSVIDWLYERVKVEKPSEDAETAETAETAEKAEEASEGETASDAATAENAAEADTEDTAANYEN